MKNELKIFLASPRGFCAGVERAIEIVKKTLIKYGKPIYVRHEIVHNKQVVEDLKTRGAIFIEEISEIEDLTRPVIFSAHGVPKTVPEEAKLMLRALWFQKFTENPNSSLKMVLILF